MFTWRGARKGDAKLTGGGQDYILVYARDREYLKLLDTRWRERKNGLEAVYGRVDELMAEHGQDYAAATAAMKAWYKTLSDEDPSKEHEHYSLIEARGAYSAGDIASPSPRPNLVYEWKGFAVPENGWRYQESKMAELDADDRLIYPDSPEKRITVKRFLKEHEEWAPPSVFYRDRRAATRALKDLMGESVFDNPKNTDVLARLIHSLTGDGDLIMDFFAGSGSTGHAVWEQNARDGKTRNWVLVQAPEKPDETEKTGRAAAKAGYTTIFEITAERLRRAAKAIGDNSLGFRVFRARETNLIVEKPIMAEEGLTGEAYVRASLVNVQQSPVVDGADDTAVAWELVLKSTTCRLDSRVQEHDVDGVSVFEFVQAEGDGASRVLVSLDTFTVDTADKLGIGADDTLFLRGDKVDDATTLTLAPRMQKNLVLLERVAREVSL